MKKFIAFTSGLLLLSFISCSNMNDSETSYSFGGVSISSSADWSYTSTNNTYVVDAGVKSLTISGDLGGKTLYCSAVNSSTADIASIYVKYISGSSSRAIDCNQGITENTNLADSALEDTGNSCWSCEYNTKWKPDDLILNTSSARTLDNPVSTVNNAVTQLSISDSSIGSLTKTVYLLANSNNNTYVTKKTTLWAYNDYCNVWVANDDANLTTDSLKQTYAERFAEKFAGFYALERNIFGKESDKIWYPDVSSGTARWGQKDMNYLSDTGTKVNIVLYDIDYDKNDGNILGFFARKDYYPNQSDLTTIFYQLNVSSSSGVPNYYSNEGKYFYIDTYFAQAEATKDKILSTLAHEFQHMINYGVKTMDKNIELDTNFNEMLSMLCEDMLQEHLGLEDSSTPKSRLVSFLVNYNVTGIRNYDSSKYTSLSYANAYVFGAWLCRNYGGAALVQKMLSNAYADNDCIVNAVNTLNSTSYTFDDLFAQFIKGCLNDSSYTFNKAAAQTVTYSSSSPSYSYPMTAINFWDTSSTSMYNLSNLIYSGSTTYKQAIKNSTLGTYLDSTYDYYGPIVFRGGYIQKLGQNYGTAIRRYGTLTSGTTSLTLTFDSNAGSTVSGMKLFLYIK